MELINLICRLPTLVFKFPVPVRRGIDIGTAEIKTEDLMCKGRRGELGCDSVEVLARQGRCNGWLVLQEIGVASLTLWAIGETTITYMDI